MFLKVKTGKQLRSREEESVFETADKVKDPQYYYQYSWNVIATWFIWGYA